MTVWVWILDHPWVLDPTDTGSGSFLHLWVEPAPDPHITRFECRFHFSPTDALETRKTLEKHETRKNPKPEKTPRRKKTRNKKTPIETRKSSERNTFIKPDGHLNST
jgi:hypothetical protein